LEEGDCAEKDTVRKMLEDWLDLSHLCILSRMVHGFSSLSIYFWHAPVSIWT